MKVNSISYKNQNVLMLGVVDFSDIQLSQKTTLQRYCWSNNACFGKIYSEHHPVQ